jgi:hypothetical protein
MTMNIHDVSFGQIYDQSLQPQRCTNLVATENTGDRLLFQSVPHGVLDPAYRVLNFASSFLVPAFDLKFGVTGDLACSFFHCAFGLLDRSLDAILVHRIVFHSFGAMRSPMSGGR